jgi:hypothetical protein
MARCGQQGCTEAMMVAQAFTAEFLAELIGDGLASATTERIIAGDKQIGVARVRITEAGRSVLAGGKGAQG